MKKQDFLFVFTLIVIFLPFFVSDALYDWYKSFNAAHGMIMSFVKFWGFALVRECIIEKDLVSSLERLYGGF